jgi:hypothetical protein
MLFFFLFSDYYYHWMRDAGLSIKDWLEINDNDLSKVKTEVDAYIDWVACAQSQPGAVFIKYKIICTNVKAEEM